MPLGISRLPAFPFKIAPRSWKRIIRSMPNRPADAPSGEREKAWTFIIRAIKVDRQTAEDSYEDYRRTSGGSGVPSREGMEQIVKSSRCWEQFTGKKVAFEEIADARIAERSRQGAGLQSGLGRLLIL